MKVLTEADLRQELKKMGPVTSYKVQPDTILTPAARSFLNEKRINIVFQDKKEQKHEVLHDNNDSEKNTLRDGPNNESGKFLLLSSGMKTDKKPEAFTHLTGNKLVPKTHPRIKLRGKVDSLEAYIIMAQTAAQRLKMKKLVEDLNEILIIVQKLMRAEVLSEPIESMDIFGLKEEEIKAISHNPKKYTGADHFVPGYEMGEMMAWLNLIRTKIRETELAACEAFFNEHEGTKREDIISVFNRLSSAVYVVMCWLKAGKYLKTEG